MSALAAALVATVQRAMAIVCRFRGHSVSSESGACESCGEQVFAP